MDWHDNPTQEEESERRRGLRDSLMNLFLDARDYALMDDARAAALAYRLSPPLVQILCKTTRREIRRVCEHLFGLDEEAISRKPVLEHMPPFTKRETRLAMQALRCESESLGQVIKGDDKRQHNSGSFGHKSHEKQTRQTQYATMR